MLTGSTQGSAVFLSGLLVYGQGHILLELELLSHSCFLAFNDRDCARMQFLSVPFYLQHQIMLVLLPVHWLSYAFKVHFACACMGSFTTRNMNAHPPASTFFYTCSFRRCSRCSMAACRLLTCDNTNTHYTNIFKKREELITQSTYKFGKRMRKIHTTSFSRASLVNSVNLSGEICWQKHREGEHEEDIPV